MKGLIQIAGVRDLAEARMLVDAGVDLIGFPLRLAVHPEDLSEEQAAAVARELPPSVRRVLITYLDRASEITDFLDFLGMNAIQLHGDIPPTQLRLLRARRPGLYIIKSVIIGRPDGPPPEQVLTAHAPYVDAFITDTYDPETGASGATGKIHDWSVSRRLAELSRRPLILAGGLNPDNVRAAVLAARPAGVDCHTGVEDASGAKDPARVAAFVRRARMALNASIANDPSR